MSKHTPGPWSVVTPAGPMEELMIAEIESDKTYVCAVWGNGEGEVSAANARLIAAAPEMFDLITRVIIESGGAMDPTLFKELTDLTNQIKNA